MNILHRVGFASSEERKVAFAEIGIEIKEGLNFIKIEENDPNWQKVSSLVKKFKLLDMIETHFSSKEKNQAYFLAMVPTWHYSYPQPEDDFGYLKKTYCLNNYCKTCGVGLQQDACFSLKKAPSWGVKSIAQTNWVFDEYFVKPDIWLEIFKPFGIECKPVLHYKTGQELDSIKQLVIPSTTNVDVENLDFEVCPDCDQKKYLPVTRGFNPKPEYLDAAIFKSNQYFGSGASASKLVYVSQELYQAINKAKLKGVDFKPSIA